MGNKHLKTALGISVALLLGIHPCRVLLADYHYDRALHILDQPETEEQDRIAISAETMPAYLKAIEKLEKAVALVPGHSGYCKALADIHLQFGKWREAADFAGVPLPNDALSGNAAYDRAYGYLKKAISLNYTNADYHLALGHLYNLMHAHARINGELRAAIETHPCNVPLRVQVAMEYLLSGEKSRALDQLRVAAALDDSCTIRKSNLARLMPERRTPQYSAWLCRSYLFQSLELAWRASGKDWETVKGIAPATKSGQEVLRLFRESHISSD